MSELSRAASRIGDKLVDILDVFDLSFFMAGTVGIGALMVAFPESSMPLLGASDPPQTSGTVLFGLVLSSYIIGLLCFAIGRPLRRALERIISAFVRLESSFDAFQQGLQQHLGETDEHRRELHALFGYDVEHGTPGTYGPAYTRMWAHVRSYPELGESFALLKRYWILAASYDGIAAAVLLWAVPVWIHLGDQTGTTWDPRLLTAALIVMSLFCWFRARQYKRYQIEELVATVVHWILVVGRSSLLERERAHVRLRQLHQDPDPKLEELSNPAAAPMGPSPAPAPDPAARPES